SSPKGDLKRLKPNSGVRSVIAATLVRFQLTDANPQKRQAALDAISRKPEVSHLEVLRSAVVDEKNETIKLQMQRLSALLTIQFDKNENARIAAIHSFDGDTDFDVRAVLNPLIKTKIVASKSVSQSENISKQLSVEKDISKAKAYQMLVEAKLAPEQISLETQKASIIKNIKNGQVAGLKVETLKTVEMREKAYLELQKQGLVEPLVTQAQIDTALKEHVFYETYLEKSKAVTTTAKSALAKADTKIGFFKTIDLGLDALSLGSIYFLAAIGLAITFGVMGVINMAHGEYIMIGAYTGYVVQLFIPNYTLSIIIALPLAFGVAFLAGVALERLVVRHLRHRPLETLLATFGISIALQQLAKNIFGTQARPLSSPEWLNGALVINDIISISYIRIAIFVLALSFLALLLFILKRTRFGLEVRAVTQNPQMASSMGINPDKINMLTFGLGSGIAGIAGVAIGLFAQVTSELGSAYIVQSFMTVVVGGVGNIWGTLAGAGMIGGFQKVIEFFNPSNTLAAQTFMIIFIIIFIQFKPKGIIALKGRAAGD
ncbi:MAG: urea ABC transporter permease subunit UrtB, partial [Nitratireductor sp.]